MHNIVWSLPITQETCLQYLYPKLTNYTPQSFFRLALINKNNMILGTNRHIQTHYFIRTYYVIYISVVFYCHLNYIRVLHTIYNTYIQYKI